MNARQKAKHYKKLYEGLLKAPVQYTVETHRTQTIRVERYYPEGLVQQNEQFIKDALVKDIGKGLAENLARYSTFYTEFCPALNQYRLVAEITVVEK